MRHNLNHVKSKQRTIELHVVTAFILVYGVHLDIIIFFIFFFFFSQRLPLHMNKFVLISIQYLWFSIFSCCNNSFQINDSAI